MCFRRTPKGKPLLSVVLLVLLKPQSGSWRRARSEHQKEAVLQLLEHQRRAVLSFKARKQEEHQNASSGSGSSFGVLLCFRRRRTPKKSGSSKQRTPERSSRVEEPLAVLQRTPERRSSEHQSGSSANTTSKDGVFQSRRCVSENPSCGAIPSKLSLLPVCFRTVSSLSVVSLGSFLGVLGVLRVSKCCFALKMWGFFFLFCCFSSSETQKNPKNRSVVSFAFLLWKKEPLGEWFVPTLPFWRSLLLLLALEEWFVPTLPFWCSLLLFLALEEWFFLFFLKNGSFKKNESFRKSKPIVLLCSKTITYKHHLPSVLIWYCQKWKVFLIKMTGFEPVTLCTQNRYATRLRYILYF